MNMRGIIREHSPIIQGRARAAMFHLGGRGPLPLVIDTGVTGWARDRGGPFVAVMVVPSGYFSSCPRRR
jgi:hypothetical protein